MGLHRAKADAPPFGQAVLDEKPGLETIVRRLAAWLRCHRHEGKTTP